MPLRLKTKFTLTTALLVLTVATLISTLYVAALVRQAIHQLDERARFVASQVLLHAQLLDEIELRKGIEFGPR